MNTIPLNLLTTNVEVVEEAPETKEDPPSHSDPGRQALRELFLLAGSKTLCQLAAEEHARCAAAAPIKVDPFGVYVNSRAERAHARLLVQLVGWAIKERLDELGLGTCPTTEPAAEFHRRLLNVPYVALAFMPMGNTEEGHEEEVGSLAHCIMETRKKFEKEGSLFSLYAQLSGVARALLPPQAASQLIAKVKMLCSFDYWMDVARITKVYHNLLLVLLSHQVMQQWVSSACLHKDHTNGNANWVNALGPVLGPTVARDPITALRVLRSANRELTRHLKQFAFRDDALASIADFKFPGHN